MESILDAGIQLILFLQSLGTWLAPIMQGFSTLGYEEFYLLLAPALYWCLDTRIGLKVGLMLMLSGSINALFKWAFLQPRPYWYDARVIAYSAETSFGLPSGHAQNAVAVFGSLASDLHRRYRFSWLWPAAIFLMAMIGISRSYLGVHFPTDILVGWLIGAAMLWLYLRYEGRISAWVGAQSRRSQIGLALACSFGLLLAGALIQLAASDFSMPAEWMQTATLTAPSNAEEIEPLAYSSVVSTAGALLGLCLGALLLAHSGGMDARGNTGQLIGRYLLGLAVTVLLWRGLGLILPGDESLVGYIFRYLRYTLIGAWIAGFAPLTFIRLKWAQKEEKKQLSGK